MTGVQTCALPIYLNRNIKDEHRIALARTVQLAYSTGEKISNGVIVGKVYGSGDKSVYLWKINDAIIDRKSVV